MRITLIGPVYPYRGGIAHHTTLLARALQAGGHQLQLLSFRRQYPGWLYPGQSDRDPSLEPLQIAAQYPLDPLYPWTWLSAARLVASYQPRAAILPWWTSFWGPAFWFLARSIRRAGIPVIFLIHNVLPHEARPWDDWLVRQVLNQGTACLLQAENERARLQALLPGAAVYFSPHPVYQVFAGHRIPGEVAKARLEISPETATILFFGIVRLYKGLEYLLEAVARLYTDGMKIHLLVAGEFWESKTKYTQRIQELGIGDLVTIAGRYIPNEEVGLYFSAADVFAAPYTGGTQSGAVQIALGFGLPVVVTQAASGGLPPGKPGVKVVPPADSRALADALKECLQTPSRRPQPALETNSWAGLVRAIEEIIEGSVERERA